MLLHIIISALLFPTISERLEENSELFQNIVNSQLSANSCTITTDTLFRIEDLSGIIPVWNRLNLGVDIRFLQDDSTEYWQAILLLDSQLVRVSENRIQPSVYNIGGFPSSVSISRNASYVLAYQHVFTGETDRNLNLINVSAGNILNLSDENAVNLTREPCGAVATEDGHVITYGFGESHPQIVSWIEDDRFHQIPQNFSDNFGWLPIHSETSNRIVAARRNSGTSAATVIVYDSSLDTVACFDSGRSDLQLCIDNSGNTILYANEFGISTYSIPAEVIVSNVHCSPACQPPVVSASDIYWACSFESDFNRDTNGEQIAIGLVSDLSTTRIVYSNTSKQFTDPDVLSISDNGYILCSMSFADQRFPRTHFYLLLSPDGEPIWISEPMCESFWENKIAGNSDMPLLEANPKLACISSDGDTINYYSDGQIVQVIIQNQ